MDVVSVYFCEVIDICFVLFLCSVIVKFLIILKYMFIYKIEINICEFYLVGINYGIYFVMIYWGIIFRCVKKILEYFIEYFWIDMLFFKRKFE